MERNDKLVLTVQELAPMLGVGEGVIYRMVKRNQIPYRKIGRQTVFSLKAIQRWLEGDDNVLRENKAG